MAYIECSKWNTPTPSSYGEYVIGIPYTLGDFPTFCLAHSWRRIPSLHTCICTDALRVYSVKQNVFNVHSAELLCTSSPKSQNGPYRTICWRHFLRHRNRKCPKCLSSSHLKVLMAFETSGGVLADLHLKKLLSQLIRKSTLALRISYYAGSLTLRKTQAGIPTFGSHF